MANMKKIAVKKQTVSRAPSKGVKTPMPKVTNKPAQRMTKQDAAMKKILEGKYGKIYG